MENFLNQLWLQLEPKREINWTRPDFQALFETVKKLVTVWIYSKIAKARNRVRTGPETLFDLLPLSALLFVAARDSDEWGF